MDLRPSALILLTVSTAATLPLHAQEAAQLEEIVVTAQKRAQNLQDVGISVTAFSSEKLVELGFNNATDIIKQTPGLNILSSSASNTNVNIRGVSQNDFADHLEGPIAVYADEGYLGAAGALNGQIYDLERVEVLRGPQGTLFGRNATGGLIHYISKAPTRDFDSYVQLDVGNYNLRQLEGAIGGPLSDRVRARFSFAGIKRDGYVKNLIGETPANMNNFSGRLQLEIDVTEKTDLRLMINGTDADERGLGGSAVAARTDPVTGLGVFAPAGAPNFTGYVYGTDPYERSIDSVGSFTKKLLHGQAKLTHEFDSFSLTSITDALHLKKDFPDEDVDASPLNLFHYSTYQDYDQYSQELRLSGENGRFKWITGAYALKIDGQYASQVAFNLALLGVPAPPFPIVTRNDYSLDVTSYALFGQGELAITDTVSGILGLRYTNDDKEISYVWKDNIGDSDAIYNKGTDPTAKKSFDNVSVKAELDWRPVEGVMIYGSYNRGHKGGNWSVPVFPPPITSADFVRFPHKQEVLTSYEAGVKSSFWSGKARLNFSGFYYDYKDYQAFSLINLAQAIVNKNATASGGEAEFIIAPVQGLEVTLNAATMTSKVKNLQYPTGGFYDAELPFSPNLSVSGSIRYEWSALGGKIAALGSYTYVGDHYFTVVNEPVNFQKAYFTADARLGYTSGNEKWSVAGWVKNLNDETYRTYGVDIAALGFTGQNVAAPRTFGISVGIKY